MTDGLKTTYLITQTHVPPEYKEIVAALKLKTGLSKNKLILLALDLLAEKYLKDE